MVWYLVLIIAITIEFLTTSLVSIWFVFGALAAIITTIFTNNLTVQLAVFFIVTTLSLIFTKKIILKYFHFSKENTNLDMVIGKTAIVTEKISKYKLGEVKVLGKHWAAVSDVTINKDEEVEVTQIDGVKLIVQKKEEK